MQVPHSRTLAVAGKDALQHPIDIVVAVRCLLAGSRGDNRVRHQEDSHYRA
jgi:hypothetical protein